MRGSRLVLQAAACISGWLAFTSSAPTASAEVTLLDHGRVLPRTWSASRDAPVFALMIYPRDIRTAAGEFSFVGWKTENYQLRAGFGGLLELESEGETSSFDNLITHGTGSFLWRGSYQYQMALSLDSLGRALCSTCWLEAALTYRHESEHITASNSGGQSPDYSDHPLVGDDLEADVALLTYQGEFLMLGRPQFRFFIPERSSYGVGTSLDVHVRFLRFARLHPFVSLYGEFWNGAQSAGRQYPDAYLLRALAGAALPSALGDVMLFASGDIGHRKGLLAYTREATLGLGARLALGPLPSHRASSERPQPAESGSIGR
jgi:hypothetical protein